MSVTEEHMQGLRDTRLSSILGREASNEATSILHTQGESLPALKYLSFSFHLLTQSRVKQKQISLRHAIKILLPEVSTEP